MVVLVPLIILAIVSVVVTSITLTLMWEDLLDALRSRGPSSLDNDLNVR